MRGAQVREDLAEAKEVAAVAVEDMEVAAALAEVSFRKFRRR